MKLFVKQTVKDILGNPKDILDRLGKHSRALIAGTGECAALQEDWNNFKQTQFEAHVLVSGPELADENKRLDKEREFSVSLA
jgi:hypothetical protein